MRHIDEQVQHPEPTHQCEDFGCCPPKSLTREEMSIQFMVDEESHHAATRHRAFDTLFREYFKKYGREITAYVVMPMGMEFDTKERAEKFVANTQTLSLDPMYVVMKVRLAIQ